MPALFSAPVSQFAGTARIPGDKSVSHRALMLGALTAGETRISGLLEAEDIAATANALRLLGAEIAEGHECVVHGCGIGGFRESAAVLDMGNSGTGARLLMGLAAAHPFVTFFTGDASLSARPMARVIAPLTEMGAHFTARSRDRLPIAVHGVDAPLPIEYRLPVASAQIKSAVLLAGLHAPGETTVIEPRPSRDHTERMLRAFGARVEIADEADGSRRITLTGQPELVGRSVAVPADLSSAAFPLVAALLVRDGRLSLPGIGLNPLRRGLIDSLLEMGARLTLANRRDQDGEPVADIIAESSTLKGIDVPPDRVPAMIDEFPILAVAAACADGVTRMRGVAELRVKESDRLAAIVDGLNACGIAVAAGPDWIEVRGTGRAPAGGARIPVRMDHRIAMAFLVLGMASARGIAIDDATAIGTSFPAFVPLMNRLGARIAVTEPSADR